jgi:PIN domain nuclease of toxin-antitoxin system
VKLLLDTNVFLWMISGTSLPARVTDAIGDPANELLLSVVSPWEMQIKSSKGNLELAAPVRQVVEAELQRGLVTLLPITLAHIEALSALPDHHRDPFDRLLIAQTLQENLTLVSADREIKLYNVPTLWS